MQHISKEHLAVILEMISFFFVTTDLYGSERLERVRDRLIESKSDPSNEGLTLPAKIFIGVGALGALYYFGGAAFPSIYRTIVHNNYSHYSTVDWILLFTVGIVLIALFVGIFSMIFLFIGAMASIPFSFIADIMIWILQQLLKVISLEGLLLGIGTLLFLISKFMSLSG